MKLVSLTPRNIGPFAPDQEINLEPDVTVITGANDVGKSALLRLIGFICAKSKDDVAGEQDVNLDYLLQVSEPWDQDFDISCDARFVQPDATYHCKLAPGAWANSRFQTAEWTGPIASNPKVLPRLLTISQDPTAAIRQQLYLNDPNDAEKRFLRLAFGDFDFRALAKLSDINFQSAVMNAEAVLNAKLQRFLPPTLPFRFRFTNTSDKRDVLFVHLIDSHGGVTGLAYRGSGIQKMVNLLGRLAAENFADGNTLIVIDEPESALHADAQHRLRHVLEQLGQQPRFQVVYATHSSSMVNSMRPKSLRLLQRVNHNERAYSMSVTDPFAGNFARVRSSLGISPADSLLYAPVALVVEGKTEVACLPVLLSKLSRAEIPGFHSVEELLASAIFLEAEGSGNISNLCRIAIAQGSAVVVLVDGDLERRWRQQLHEHENVPLIALPDGKEFEEIVPRETYFEALREELQLDAATASVAAFERWRDASALVQQIAFTKQVDRWLTDEVGAHGLPKAAVMYRACVEVPVDQIEIKPLVDLLEAMQQALST